LIFKKLYFEKIKVFIIGKQCTSALSNNINFLSNLKLKKNDTLYRKHLLQRVYYNNGDVVAIIGNSK
jgi:hypothetical protein